MDTSPRQEAQGETKPGPANPRAEGAEAPTPPGGPQRQDAAGATRPGGHDDEASKAAAEQPDEGGTIPIEDEQPSPRADRDAGGLQQENAETSQDQPSDGVG